MTTGRPPKPVEQKRVLGNPGKRPLPTPIVLLPTVPEGVPPFPPRLRRRGREAWSRLWQVGREWLSPTTDVDLITILCQGLDQREDLYKILRADGLMIAGSMKQKVAHPALAQLRALEAHLTRWWSLCGFTPSDRTRLGIAELERVSKLDNFIQKAASRRGAGGGQAPAQQGR